MLAEALASDRKSFSLLPLRPVSFPSNNIRTLWPQVRIYARDCGEIDPHDAANAPLFRGEEAFAPDRTGWRRWSKPSPEPPLDDEFERLLLHSIERDGPLMSQMAHRVMQQIAAAHSKAPVLVAVLRAGVPAAALLAPLLARHYDMEVPIAALSLFDGLGWDTEALHLMLDDFPNRPFIFVDGWTSGGGVAGELRRSYHRWIEAGHEDFTQGEGPQLAVLDDPRGLARFAAVRADVWVPSCLFTAPQTLGFSRGFADETGGLFGVYRFPERLQKPHLVEAWLGIHRVPPANEDFEALAASAQNAPPPPKGWRVHANEVARALINRSPEEVQLARDENWCQTHLAPLIRLCELRGVPVRFNCAEVARLGALATARMPV